MGRLKLFGVHGRRRARVAVQSIAERLVQYRAEGELDLRSRHSRVTLAHLPMMIDNASVFKRCYKTIEIWEVVIAGRASLSTSTSSRLNSRIDLRDCRLFVIYDRSCVETTPFESR